jgi:uncharacterized protein YicC (UPF0701 family)
LYSKLIYLQEVNSMIRSMTAFSRQETSSEVGDLVLELRTVNHRYLDISLRLPEELRNLEPLLREQIAARLGRGKLECNLRYNSPELSQIELPVDLEQLKGMVTALLARALDDLVAVREREGKKLAQIIRERCESMDAIVAEVKQQLPEILQLWREKLINRLKEAKLELDQDRLEQEMVYLAQKTDVAEEIDRLSLHIAEVKRVLGADKPVGRRLDFLMQELNREANTLGSKSIHADTTRASVDLKVLIEQMREQIQNIE